jgi:hypothetical protein
MVKGIRISTSYNNRGVLSNLKYEYIEPRRSKNLVIFNNQGTLLLWEPSDIKSTKTEMKQYVSDIAKALSGSLGHVSILAHGLLKYVWVEGYEYSINVGSVPIASIGYTDDSCEKVDFIVYHPKFKQLSDISNFI